MKQESAHFYTKIGMTVKCLYCGKKYYIDLKHKPLHCPHCRKITGNHYDIIKEEYERG